MRWYSLCIRSEIGSDRSSNALVKVLTVCAIWSICASAT
jgi:hypothetical protein